MYPGPVSLPPRGGPKELLVTDANRDKPADPPYERGIDCGDDVLFRLRGWELVIDCESYGIRGGLSR